MSAETSAHEKRNEFAWLAVLLIVVITVRALALGADPLPDTEWGFIIDWGDWSRNARTHALWGIWMVDDNNLGLYGAFGFTLAIRLCFELLGVGQAQTNLVNAISGILTVLAVYSVVRSFAGQKTALLAALLMGVNPITITHDRSGYPESFQLLFVVLAVTTIFSSRGWVAALGGLCFALAIMAKWTGLVLAPIVGLIWISQWAANRFFGLEPHFSRRRLLLYGTVAASVLLIYAVAFVLPHRADLGLEIAASSEGF
ncbi:MAG TPA: glycosyltransferase family 39 protein, partial [Gemmatimonadales bacterium]|nr:glycosyltransferase family 39 protein [Gemmatimonadales bacterium]